MVRFCQFVMGPAGAGKSTYCSTMLTYFQNIGRSVQWINLDPAAERFTYEPTIDIKELIALEDVMEELGYGPNGGLLYCMEYLLKHLDWLDDELGTVDDDYFIIDCPGQIELYTAHPVMKDILDHLRDNMSFHVCGVYLLECQFIEDPTKYFAGVMSAMSAMVQLEIPHINVMSKMDLIQERDQFDMERYLEADASILHDMTSTVTRPSWRRLNEALVELLENHAMVQFTTLNIHDEDSVSRLVGQIDAATNYSDYEELKDRLKNYGDRPDGASDSDAD